MHTPQLSSTPVLCNPHTLSLPRYKSPLDCLVRTFRAEGIRGLYKGWLAAYTRTAPHTVFTFVFFEQFRNLFLYLWYGPDESS